VVVADAARFHWRDSLVVSETAQTTVEASAAKPTVADAMHRGLVHCAPDATLREVATLMAEAAVHCVVVLEPPGDGVELWGVVSDLDLVAAASVRSLDDQRAGGTAMTPAVRTFPHESLETAAKRMTAHDVSHLVVVDDVRHQPVGVLSTLDLVRTLATAEPQGRSDDRT
jgi:CBS domain-containing protein